VVRAFSKFLQRSASRGLTFTPISISHSTIFFDTRRAEGHPPVTSLENKVLVWTTVVPGFGAPSSEGASTAGTIAAVFAATWLMGSRMAT